MTTTLSLKLSPEVAKIMPWIVAAKKTGDAKQIAWAKKEYAIASEKAAQREWWEREFLERERKWAEEEAERAASNAFWREYDIACSKQREEEKRTKNYWDELGFPYAEEEGFFETTPSHSSQKGRRRWHSEIRSEGAPGLNYYGRHDWGRYDFGSKSHHHAQCRPRHKNGSLKDGRKPRTFRDYR